MQPLEFSKIRIHDGSQDNGFEELICQLAHLCPPENADYFVRKEGAGGDAGVECYWKLKDGSEHAWQAKFFLNTLESSQWSQLSKSVESALEKHPDIAKYYVCLPRDWTDSRKKTKSGKNAKSAWNKWQEHTKKWKRLAQINGMTVEFDYWGKHEISQMLQTDDPHFSGRALYWFNEPVIQLKQLNKIAQRSRESLGDRFTPEYHLELPIAHQFDGLGLTPEWEKRLSERNKALSVLADVLVREFFKGTDYFKDDSRWLKLRDSFLGLQAQFLSHIEKNSFLENSSSLLSLCSEAIEHADRCSNAIFDLREGATDEEKREINKLSSKFYDLNNQLDEFRSFLSNKAVASALSKAAVL
ncbi:MAG: hypothetical protein KAU22_05240, partial [Desulfuromonadales bacterium]|nr:hypothetical protein [Desulfuromonadales bacterium]